MPALNLETLTLQAGSHKPDGEFCVMEAVAYIAGELWTASPECVSPVIAAFLRGWNDSLDDETRQQLKPYIPRVIGTNTGVEDERTRAWLAADWLVRECAPAFLRCAKLTEHAETLESLAALDSPERAKAAHPAVSAAGDAARAAAKAAAGDAVRDVAWAAARAAAGDAARAAAGDVAWDVAWDALEPTVKLLQPPAFLLLDRMIEVGAKE